MAKGGNRRAGKLSQEGVTAIGKWPAPPAHFTAPEVAAWKRVGRAAMTTRSVASCDLVLAERVAQLHARVDAAYRSTSMKPSALAALVRLEADLLGRLGLSPSGRATVGQLARPKKKVFDPLAEFS